MEIGFFEMKWLAIVLLPIVVSLGFVVFRMIGEMEQQLQDNCSKEPSVKSAFPFVPEEFALKKQALDQVTKHARETEDHLEQQASKNRCKWFFLALIVLIALMSVCALLGLWVLSDDPFGLVHEEHEWEEMQQKNENKKMAFPINHDLDCQALCNQGNHFLLRGNITFALKHYKEAMTLNRTEINHCDLTSSLGINDVEHAIIHYTKAFFEAQQNHKSYHDVVVWLAGKLGYLWIELQEYETAMKWFEMVLDDSNLMQSRTKVAIFSGYATSLAGLSPRVGPISKLEAYEFHSMAFELYYELPDRVGIARELANMGDLLLRHVSALENDDNTGFAQHGYLLVNKAREIQQVNKAREIQRDIGDRNGEAATLCILAHRYSHTQRSVEALDHYMQASHIY